VTPRLIALVLVAALAAVGNVLADPSAPAGYTIYQTIALDPAQSGISGSLQILQDDRVTPAYRDIWGSSTEPEIMLGEDDPFVKAVTKEPLKNGKLRLVDAQGQVLAEEEFRVPLAKIETEFLYGTKFPSYLVSIDYGRGYGPHSGPSMRIQYFRFFFKGGRWLLKFHYADGCWDSGDPWPIRAAFH
jgi:hypothetical protein